MLRLLFNEFEEAFGKLTGDDRVEELSVATAKLAYPYVDRMARRMQEKYPGLKIHTYCIRNDFFGERITVSGLITGQDLMAQLKDQELGERLLLPCNMLKMDEDIFLDDFTLDEVADTLQVPIDIVKSSGQDFVNAILGIDTRRNRDKQNVKGVNSKFAPFTFGLNAEDIVVNIWNIEHDDSWTVTLYQRGEKVADLVGYFTSGLRQVGGLLDLSGLRRRVRHHVVSSSLQRDAAISG